MNLSMKYLILYVSDSKRAIHFYRDILGLPIRAEHGTYIEFDTGSTILALNTRKAPETSRRWTFRIHLLQTHLKSGLLLKM